MVESSPKWYQWYHKHGFAPVLNNACVKKKNAILQNENVQLKEKLYELEYQQKILNNLIFEGVQDALNETDLACIGKIRHVSRGIPGRDISKFRVDKCHRIDGAFKPSGTCRILCCFNWHCNIQCILRNRKLLPRGVFVVEDLPEEWVDRRKILKLIFNAAKRSDLLKEKTRLVKDKLIIDGQTFTVAPENNVNNANALLDVTSTCQRSDSSNQVMIFFGSHSPFSNLHPCTFRIDNITYNSVEQYLQSQKAAAFDDDCIQMQIMHETNAYKIKKLGFKIQNFNHDQWKKVKKQFAYKAVYAKFSQNSTLCTCLLQAKDKVLAESSPDHFWGIGLHIHDRLALDCKQWKNKDGGAMCEILKRVQEQLL